MIVHFRDRPLFTMFIVCLIAFLPGVILAGETDLDALVKRLSEKTPEVQIAACREIGALGEEGAKAGAALTETMLRAAKNPEVWQAASDALEKVAPKVHPHVLTIMLNNDSKSQMRLGAAKELAGLGESGAASLPVLKALWSEPSNNYKQAALLQALHAVGPKDPQVSKLVLMIVRGQLDKVLLGSACKGTALTMVVESNLTDDEINSALLASVVGQRMGHETRDQLMDRVQSGKVSAEKVTQAFLTVFVSEARRNHGDIGSVKALKALGANAASAVPTLRQLRMHPDPTIRGYVKEVLEVIEQAEAVETPEAGDAGELWEITHMHRNGRAEIKCGDRKLNFSPRYDRTVVFEASGAPLRDEVAINKALKSGVRLKVQLQNEKVLSVRIAE